MAKDITNVGYNLFVKEGSETEFTPLGLNGKRTDSVSNELTLRGAMKLLSSLRDMAEWERIANDDADELPTLTYQVRNEFDEILWEETMY